MVNFSLNALRFGDQVEERYPIDYPSTSYIQETGVERDLTKKFEEMRKSVWNGDVRPVEQKPIKATQQLPPAWIPAVRHIQETLNKIHELIAFLETLHSECLLQSFDRNPGIEGDISIRTKQIMQLFSETYMRLKLLLKSRRGDTESDKHLRKNIGIQLNNQIQTMLTKFRHQQNEYLEKKSKQDNQGDLFGYRTNFDNQDPDEVELEPFNVSFTDQQMMRVSVNTRRVQSESAAIREIVDSINQLADLMNDMAMLVEGQGEMVERIDHNMEDTEIEINLGVDKLKDAHEIIEKTPCKKLIYILVILIIIATGAVIIKFSISR